jgi:hypothetical protein
VTEELRTICPHCDQHHDALTMVYGDVDYANDGDVTMCFRCGQLCVFDREETGGLRKPTKKEQRSFDRDQKLQRLQTVWKIAKRQ